LKSLSMRRWATGEEVVEDGEEAEERTRERSWMAVEQWAPVRSPGKLFAQMYRKSKRWLPWGKTLG